MQVSPDHYAFLLVKEKVPAEFISLMNYPFTEVLDSRDAHVSDGVGRALGRRPRDFAESMGTHTCHSRVRHRRAKLAHDQ